MDELDLELTPLVFVYGTLKYGCSNWSWALSKEEYIGPRVTKDKYLLANRGFPYAFPHTLDIPEELLRQVQGDVFEISNARTLMRLDALEGEGWHYDRVLIQTTQDETCWMYVQNDLTMVQSCGACHQTEEGYWKWNG